MDSGIYSILNKSNGKVYVGQAVKTNRRLSNHKSALRGNHHTNKHLQSSWNKYGEDAFEFNVLEYCSEKSLDCAEKWWIHHFSATNREKGYNKEDGGNKNKHHSLESRRKMSEAKKGENNPNYGIKGENHHRFGKQHSLDTLLKMSKSHNSTGYFRVTKMSTSSCTQGYRWGYSYYENGKKKLISSVDIEKLELKVKSKGLFWFPLKKDL